MAAATATGFPSLRALGCLMNPFGAAPTITVTDPGDLHSADRALTGTGNPADPFSGNSMRCKSERFAACQRC